jgi:glycosyltransferase involved in cell wall biosynthesis
MPATLNILFAEPPSSRRVGGIETALSGLAGALSAENITVTRSATPTAESMAAADVVHFHGIWETLHHQARGTCVRMRKPFLVSPHGMLEPWAFRHRAWKKWPYFHLIERRSIARARVVLATSDTEAAALRRWFSPEIIRVLPLGLAAPVPMPEHVAARRQLAWSDDERVILFLSRLHEKKGLHLLIDAVARAAQRANAKIHLVIVGEGDPAYVAPLQRATAAWRGNHRATWVGACWSERKWDYLAAADLMCLPSFSENFGLAVLESLFAGTPVLTTPATPWGAWQNSLPIDLAAPNVAALTEALTGAIARPRPAEADRARTKQTAAQLFAWSGLAPRYAALYRELVQPS